MKFLTALLLLIVVVLITVDAYPKNGEISGGVQKEKGKTSWQVQGKQEIYSNKHGSINLNAGASKQPGSKTQKGVGIEGSFKWGRK